jgi:hypothetical protein
MAKTGFTVIWEFQVKRDHKRQFEGAYGANGAWAQLFRKSPKYSDTQLLRDEANENRYITIGSMEFARDVREVSPGARE